MLSTLFARSGAPEEIEHCDSPTEPAPPSGQLRHAMSTPALRIIAPVSHRAPTLPSTTVTSKKALLSPTSPSGMQFTLSSPVDSLPSSSSFSASTNVSPVQNNAPSPASDNDSSFARKIRYRLSSVTRKPLDLEISKGVKRPVRAMSNLVVGNQSNIYGTKNHSSFELQKPFSPPDLDIKPSKQAPGKTFLKGGLAKAHKRLFGKAKKNDDYHDASINQDQEDLNLLYSNGMVPLEFPSEEDEDNQFTFISHDVDKEFETDGQSTPTFTGIERHSNPHFRDYDIRYHSPQHVGSCSRMKAVSLPCHYQGTSPSSLNTLHLSTTSSSSGSFRVA